MVTVYLALGSNIGDREHNLREAIALLAGAGVRVKRVSSFYETEPVDYLDQAWFLNAVLRGETNLRASELLRALRALELRMGSKKAFAKGPRLIDLDILLYGDDTIDTPELQVPHPRMLQRNFVLVPLAELEPLLRHPLWPAPAKEMLARSGDRSAVRLFAPPSP
ncbi:MAG TPA: 2-amino-4-hydroxy-6-hydroxymethyldihydropteridine diphosphokinase [Candidatus Acidoferrum sp.]